MLTHIFTVVRLACVQNNSSLYFDLGNTNMKCWALYADQVIYRSVELSNEACIVTLCDSVILNLTHRNTYVNNVYIASVKSVDFTARLVEYLDAKLGLKSKIFKVVSSIAGVSIAYDDPSFLGVDRWLGMQACVMKARKYAVYISAGSAITVDFIDPNGHHMGGLIAPGVGMQRAMLNSTDRSGTQFKPLRQLNNLGASTQECVDAGICAMLLGFLKQVVDKINHVDDDVDVYVAGGDALTIIEYLSCDLMCFAPRINIEYSVDAVLDGMRRISEFAECLAQLHE